MAARLRLDRHRQPPPKLTLEIAAKSRDRTRDRRRAYDREAAQRNRATCGVCGGPCGAGTAGKALRCAECVQVAHEAAIALVARMYNEGRSTREICDALGYGPKSQPGLLIRECRRRGLIGYRYGAYAARAA